MYRNRKNSIIDNKLNKILDKMKETEISAQIVKGKWLDLYGCRHLPHSNRIGQVIRMHGDWIAVGGSRQGVYIRRVRAASD